ncbi:MAG: ubiquinone biosynthesis protein UbiJ [Paraglaciecola sp.]|jgi:ubiquinone biosynthesis protein UbiJ
MPFAQLLSAGLELGINQLLKLDPQSQVKLKKLAGKQLKVTIREVPWPLLFSFSEHVDVLVEQNIDNMQFNDHAQQNQAADCEIELALETLPELQDSSKISQLIQQKKLLLEGDIHVAQAFSALIKELDIDWEEQLSHYTGDVLAHQTFASMKSVFLSAQQNMQQFSTSLSERLMQDQGLTIPATQVEEFCQQVNGLRSAAQRLEARLILLENQPQGEN